MASWHSHDSIKEESSSEVEKIFAGNYMEVLQESYCSSDDDIDEEVRNWSQDCMDKLKSNGSWEMWHTLADFAGVDDIITKLAKEREPGIEIINFDYY